MSDFIKSPCVLPPQIGTGCISYIYNTRMSKSIKFQNLSHHFQSFWQRKLDQVISFQQFHAKELNDIYQKKSYENINRSLSQYSKYAFLYQRSKNSIIDKIFSKPLTQLPTCAYKERFLFIDRKYKNKLQNQLNVLKEIQGISKEKQRILKAISNTSKSPLVEKLKKDILKKRFVKKVNKFK